MPMIEDGPPLRRLAAAIQTRLASEQVVMARLKSSPDSLDEVRFIGLESADGRTRIHVQNSHERYTSSVVGTQIVREIRAKWLDEAQQTYALASVSKSDFPTKASTVSHINTQFVVVTDKSPLADYRDSWEIDGGFAFWMLGTEREMTPADMGTYSRLLEGARYSARSTDQTRAYLLNEGATLVEHPKGREQLSLRKRLSR